MKKLINRELDLLLESAIISEEPIDVLPMVRKHIKSFEEFINQAIEWDLGYITFHGGFMGLRGMGLYLNEDNKLTVGDSEYDKVIITKYSNMGERQTYYSTYSLMRDIAIILLNDCTGCCDALDYILVSRDGLLSEGIISGTYHS